MNEEKIQRWLDAAAVLAFALLCLSGAVLHGSLPSTAREVGIAADPLSRRLFMSNGSWVHLHDGASLAFLFLLLPNLYFQRAAIAGWPRGRLGERFARAAAGVVAALSLALWFTTGFSIRNDHVEVPGALERGGMLGDEEVLKGLTLTGIERRLNLPAAYLVSAIGMPPDAPLDVPLSALMQRYNFTMDVFESAVLSHRVQESISAPQATPT